MADNEKFFPKIAESNWWKLRNLFKHTIPTEVTANYLSSALSMTEQSVRWNIISPFKKLKILDEAGKPTDLAFDWLDDSKYPAVCQTLFSKTYPQEVRDLYPSAVSDPKAITSWFISHCRCGQPAARMFTTFYRLLLRADPSAPMKPSRQKRRPRASWKQAKNLPLKNQAGSARWDETEAAASLTTERQQASHGRLLPQLRINIQLHISPETTVDQIDRIFESMARHLHDFRI